MNRNDDAKPDAAEPWAVFEVVWVARVDEIRRELGATLQLILRLTGDKPTMRAVISGDPAARRELEFACGRLTTLCASAAELMPAPERLRHVGEIVTRALERFDEAASAYANALEDGFDFAAGFHATNLLTQGGAIWSELDRGEEASVGA